MLPTVHEYHLSCRGHHISECRTRWWLSGGSQSFVVRTVSEMKSQKSLLYWISLCLESIQQIFVWNLRPSWKLLQKYETFQNWLLINSVGPKKGYKIEKFHFIPDFFLQFLTNIFSRCSQKIHPSPYNRRRQLREGCTLLRQPRRPGVTRG